MQCFSGKVRNVQNVPLRLILPKGDKKVVLVSHAKYGTLSINLIIGNKTKNENEWLSLGAGKTPEKIWANPLNEMWIFDEDAYSGTKEKKEIACLRYFIVRK